MKMYPGSRRLRVLQGGVLTTASLAATLAFGAAPALASYKASVQGGTLEIVGNGASDKLALHVSAGTLQVDVGDDGTIDFTFDLSSFNALNVQGGGGNDVIRVDDNAALLAGKTVTLEGGAGNDTLIGGAAAETLIGGTGNDVVNGGRGNDVAILGAGNDSFNWNPGDGSDTVEGQSGNDTLNFNASNAGENIDFSANGPRVPMFRDLGNVTMDLNGVDAVNLNTSVVPTT